MKGWLRHLGTGALAATIVIAWSLALATTVSCGGNHRQSTLRAAVISVNTARDAFIRWDKDRQLKIVEESSTREESDRRLLEHRKQRDAILFVFGGIYERLAKASTSKSERELDDAVKASKAVSDAMRDLDPASEGPRPADLPPPPTLQCEPCASCSTAPCPSLDAIRTTITDAGVDA